MYSTEKLKESALTANVKFYLNSANKQIEKIFKNKPCDN